MAKLTNLYVASVQDVGHQGDLKYVVVIRSKYAGTTHAARFNALANANQVAATVNKAFEREGRLWKPEPE